MMKHPEQEGRSYAAPPDGSQVRHTSDGRSVVVPLWLLVALSAGMSVKLVAVLAYVAVRSA
ncbi:hypothetical protein [Anianabacter salinae]|uniref:hypothetical protein n=1 Tax=Anianabacter salinae TaxID=2851023 RepID=UPI00225E38DE|nr:hypothetical protein [Anianabacter salinae]MBV0912976.1 hypothetical protein [Anianabacter salinae]